jgi:hypothetical protein
VDQDDGRALAHHLVLDRPRLHVRAHYPVDLVFDYEAQTLEAACGSRSSR